MQIRAFIVFILAACGGMEIIMKKFGAVLILCIMMLNLFTGCNKEKMPDESDVTTETPASVTKPGTEPETEDPNIRKLRVMSFNVHNTLPKENGVLTETAQNRINAVKAEIGTYSPDMLGLQEDVTSWTNNLNLEGYTAIYDPEVSGSYEHCAIYFKSDLTCMEYGWGWLTSDGTKATVALTVSDILAGGKYEMTAEELARLDINSSTKDSFLRDSITYYIDADGNKQFSSSYNYLTARRMTYIVLDINGQKVIYVNTHLQHRSQNAVFISDAMLKLRNNERLAQFTMVQEKIEALKQIYTDAVVVVTGDFNDVPDSDVYKAATALYQDASRSAESVVGMKGTWNAYYSEKSHGDNYPNSGASIDTTTLDFCFVSENATVNTYRSGLGYATFKTEDGTDKTMYTSDHRSIIIDIAFLTSGTPDSPDDPIGYPDYSGGESGGNDEGEEPTVQEPVPSVPLQKPATAITSASVYSGTPDISWYTGDTNEYTLTTADQLMGFAQLGASNNFNAITIKLGANMVINSGTLEEIKANTNAYKWTFTEFKGILDGQGLSISGLYIEGNGMFSAASGTLQNFSLVNTYVSGAENVGTLAGTRTGGDLTVFNVLVEAEVVGSGNSVGGFIGYTTGEGSVTVRNCTFKGKVSGGENVGGLIGYVEKTDSTLIKNCALTVDVTGTKYAGGAVGYILGSGDGTKSAEISNTTLSGTVSCSGNGTGGLVGFVFYVSREFEIDSCTVSATVTGAGKHKGVVMGRAGNSTVRVSNCLVEGKISTTDTIANGGVIAWVNYSKITCENIIVALDGDSNLTSAFGHYHNGGNDNGVYMNVYYDKTLYSNPIDAFASTKITGDSIYGGKTTDELKSIASTFGEAWTSVEGDYPVPTAASSGIGALVQE